MNTDRKAQNYASYIVTLLLTTLLAGCGGGDEPEPLPTCLQNPLNFLMCVFVPESGTSPTGPGTTGKVSSATQVLGTPIGVDGDEASVISYADFEPNDSIDNANIVSFPVSLDASATGVSIDGSISGADDDADSFVFTPARSGLHSIYVCAETCESAAQSDDLSILLLDQYQTTVDGTTVIGTTNLEVAAELTAGLAYYVQLRGNGPDVTQQDYRLVIVD